VAALMSAVAVVASASDLTTVNNRMASMPLAFTENQGQWPDSILFRADAGGAVMWFTRDGVYYQFTRHSSVGQDPRDPDAIDVKTAQGSHGQTGRSAAHITNRSGAQGP
jgi:hypothetical protein